MAVQYYMAWAIRPAPITVKIIAPPPISTSYAGQDAMLVGSLWPSASVVEIPEKSWRLIIHIRPLVTRDCVSLSTSSPASKVCTQWFAFTSTLNCPQEDPRLHSRVLYKNTRYLSSVFFRLWKIHQFHPLSTAETYFCQGDLIRSAFYLAKLHCLKKWGTLEPSDSWCTSPSHPSALCFYFPYCFFLPFKGAVAWDFFYNSFLRRKIN